MCLLQVGKAHCPIVDVMINVFALEECLSNQPLAAKLTRSVNASCAVVAILAECEGLGQDIEVVAAECQPNGRRRIAGVVASDTIAVCHSLDARLLEQRLDL